MFADLKMLERALKMDLKPSVNWRTSPEYYVPVAGGWEPQYLPGLVRAGTRGI